MGVRTRVGILLSGRGSNMAALLQAARDPTFPAEPVLVLSNRAGAGGLDLARAAGIAAEAVPHRGLSRPEHEALMDAALRAHGVEVVCLAGYMRLLTPLLVDRWSGRMLNIHPSLLPAFPGLHTHERALAAGVKLHGCTVHLVTETMDEGPVLAQAAVPVLPGDTPDTLAVRVLQQEHLLYPAALRAFVTGRPTPAGPADALRNPGGLTAGSGGIELLHRHGAPGRVHADRPACHDRGHGAFANPPVVDHRSNGRDRRSGSVRSTPPGSGPPACAL